MTSFRRPSATPRAARSVAAAAPDGVEGGAALEAVTHAGGRGHERRLDGRERLPVVVDDPVALAQAVASLPLALQAQLSPQAPASRRALGLTLAALLEALAPASGDPTIGLLAIVAGVPQVAGVSGEGLRHAYVATETMRVAAVANESLEPN